MYLHYRRAPLWSIKMPLCAFLFYFLCFVLLFYAFFRFSMLSSAFLLLTHALFYIQAIHTFLSRGNPTEVLKWWIRLNSMTYSFLEAAGFKHFVETQPTETAKKSLLCALVEWWWDTTHTFHIAGVEMTITPYDMYRLTGLRVDGIVPTFTSFLARVRPNQEYLGISLWATSADLPTLWSDFCIPPYFCWGSSDYHWKGNLYGLGLSLYLIGMTLDCNTSQTVSVRWLNLFVDFQQTAQYNWGGVALANFYAAITSFVGPWRIWQVHSLPSSFLLHYASSMCWHIFFHLL